MNVMLLNPIVCLIFNAKAKRWHPVYFREAPLPGPYSPDKPVRHKSGGHHTEGFATREEAVAGAKAIGEALVKHGHAESCKFALSPDSDIAWDGEDIPATVAMFTDLPDGSAKRVL